MVDINLQSIMDMLSQLIGIEGAEKILATSIQEANLPRQVFYTEEEFQAICERLKERGGAIRMFANLVRTSDYREKQYQRIINQERREKEDLANLYKKMGELNEELRLSNEKLKEANESMLKMQQDMLRNEKLATIGQLAASIAHELRNPLTSIKNIKYYLGKYLKHNDPKVDDFLVLLSRDIERISTILTDLLDFSQSKEYRKSEILLNVLVDQCVKRTCRSEKVRVVKEYSPEIRMARVDQDKVAQALGNLITNACDAMNNEGTLTVTTALREGGQGGPGSALIVIKDTGCGIDGETMRRIFEPLFSTKTRGIGLGLPIARDIIEAHGGSIQVESGERGGTTFTVMLPL